MNPVAALVVFVALDVAATWAAGYALAMEDWVGGTRTRFENWAYRNADQVRSEDAADVLEVDLFWDRVQPWRLFGGSTPRQREDPAGRWTYRGVPGSNVAAPGRKVPTRRVAFPQTAYSVVLLDGVPLGRADRLATVLRGKAADLWGCPKCSGMWGGLAVALVVSHVGPWGYGWLFVVALHVAAWGIARRVGWSE